MVVWLAIAQHLEVYMLLLTRSFHFLCSPGLPLHHDGNHVYITYLHAKSLQPVVVLKISTKKIQQMQGWLSGHWLTKYTDKESTFPSITTFHTTIPTQVAVTNCVNQCVTCYLCRDGCVNVKCSNVVKCVLLICVISKPLPSFSHPYISAGFLLGIFVSTLSLLYIKWQYNNSYILVVPTHPWSCYYVGGNMCNEMKMVSIKLKDHQNMLNVDCSFASN